MPLRRLLLLLACLLGVGVLGATLERPLARAEADEEVVWLEDLDAAREAAKASGKPLFVAFT